MKRLSIFLAIGALAFLKSGSLGAEIVLPALFSDHMVLQAGREAPIWGRAAPGETVTLTFAAQTKSTEADDSGFWRIDLDPMEAGTSGVIKISGENEIEIREVRVGEVWICSGQSNMEWPLRRALNGADEVAGADHPDIRLFHVEHIFADKPEVKVNGTWKPCTPETAEEFSAVAYFFGRHVHQHTGVPVGLIQSTWSGTPAESWTPYSALRADPDLARALHGWNEKGEGGLVDWLNCLKKHNDQYLKNPQPDPGNQGFEKGWAEPEADTFFWQEMELPGLWEDNGLMMNGVIWFRKEIEVPPAWKGGPLLLELGPIDDCDTTYFNGMIIGSTSREEPFKNSAPRKYEVPTDLIRTGKNVIAVRVFNPFWKGGFSGPPENMRLTFKDASSEPPLPLQGRWKYRIAHRLDPSLAIKQPLNPSFMPSGLFNGMIAPMIPYAIRGVIWYQGEGNVWWAHNYQKLFPAMITAWRRSWGQGDFPFLFVQLANFTERVSKPQPSMWAELREAQLKTLALPNTGMAVAIDLGTAERIHPMNKQDVGKRLGLIARARSYGDPIEYSGPSYRSMKREGEKIRIFFDHVGKSLAVRNGNTLKGFTVAGENRCFRWAEARIDGDTVLVWNDTIDAPCAARYAWADNPECNLYNQAGLPASPFRTDDWPAITDFMYPCDKDSDQ
ncbi:MAG: sialate O-acetylesterase [Planctomycetota bacterium]